MCIIQASCIFLPQYLYSCAHTSACGLEIDSEMQVAAGETTDAKSKSCCFQNLFQLVLDASTSEVSRDGSTLRCVVQKGLLNDKNSKYKSNKGRGVQLSVGKRD